MGRGNWIPSTENLNKFVYVEYIKFVDDEGNETDDDFCAGSIDMLFDSIFECYIPSKSWYVCRQNKRSYELSSIENGLFKITIHPYESYIAVCFEVREDAPAFAKFHLQPQSKKLFDFLSKRFNVRVRTSCWTTAQYKTLD